MGATEIVSFENELENLRKAGFTDEQVEAVWGLVTRMVTEVANRILR